MPNPKRGDDTQNYFFFSQKLFIDVILWLQVIKFCKKEASKPPGKSIGKTDGCNSNYTCTNYHTQCQTDMIAVTKVQNQTVVWTSELMLHSAQFMPSSNARKLVLSIVWSGALSWLLTIHSLDLTEVPISKTPSIFIASPACLLRLFTQQPVQEHTH